VLGGAAGQRLGLRAQPLHPLGHERAQGGLQFSPAGGDAVAGLAQAGIGDGDEGEVVVHRAALPQRRKVADQRCERLRGRDSG
ncbi:hypothetical protein DKX15_20045, partial [Enterococcus faecium]